MISARPARSINLALLAGLAVSILILMYSMRELQHQRQLARGHLLHAWTLELQRPMDAFRAALAALPRLADPVASGDPPVPRQGVRQLIEPMGVSLHEAWGLHSLQVWHPAWPQQPLAAWSVDVPSGGTHEPDTFPADKAHAIDCSPVCVQRAVLPFASDARIAVFEYRLDHSLQRFVRRTGARVGVLGVAAGASDFALRPRQSDYTAGVHDIGNAEDDAAAMPVAADLPLPSASLQVRVVLIGEDSGSPPGDADDNLRHWLLVAVMLIVGGMLLLALLWVPLQRWRGVMSALPQLAQLPVARLRDHYPAANSKPSHHAKGDAVTRAVSTVANRIHAADTSLQLTRRALKQTRRNLQFVQSMARVVSWSGEPISGALAFGQGAAEIHPVLAHVRSWSEFIAFVHPEDRLKLLRAWRAGEPGGRLDVAFRIEIDRVSIDLHAVAQFDAAGRARTLRAFGMMQDVSDMRLVQRLLADHADRLEAQVAERTRELSAERDRAHARADEKSRFAASMSHEIRTPMNAVLGLAQIGVQEGGDAATVARYREILAAGKHLLQVVNDVLDLSKLEAGQVSVEEQVFDIADVVEQALGMVRPQADAKGLRLEYPQRHALASPVRGDALRLRQVLINLLANAVRFTETGMVSLDVVREQERVCFHVRDTGVGMTPAELQQLFRPFYQAPTGAPTQRQGTGLGLAISNELVQVMGGDIQVDSRLGSGSEFVLRLPLPVADSTPCDRESPRAARNGQPCLAGLRILVVDDVAINRKVTAHLLRVDGAKVETLADGAAAVRRILDGHAAPIDLVLMDVQMSGVDGRAATRRLREAGCMVPVIGCTADSSNAAFEASLEAGMQDQLIKPLMREMLIERILVQIRRTAVDPDEDEDSEQQCAS